MDTKNFLLKSTNGKNTRLDKAYTQHINSVIKTLDEEKEARWETYSLIFAELVKQNKTNHFKEIKYRLDL
jgi:hypothetical protein